MSKKKIIISGCSYTVDAEWPSTIWSDANILNFAKSGASNNYIADSIIHNIDLYNKPDFVFILWTGLNKLDLVLPGSEPIQQLAEGLKYYGKIDNSYYLFDGGDKFNYQVVKDYAQVKDDSWPDIKNLLDFWALGSDITQECIDKNVLPCLKFAPNSLSTWLQLTFLMFRMYNDSKFFNDRSLGAIANCTTFLEYHKIPYKFSFYCDVFSSHANAPLLQGRIDKTNLNFSRIAWEKYVKLTPYEYGIKHNLISNDQFHLTTAGMNKWANEINSIFNKEKLI